jgi:DNA-binding Lrp family transcriptional regulator
LLWFAQEKPDMVKAVVLINVDSDKTAAAAELLAQMDGITEVYSVAGNYDLVAVVSVAQNAAVAQLVTQGIRQVPGIARTETLIAFRSYSKNDLEGLLPMD